MAQQAMYEQMVFPTRFMWGYGGKQVRARPRNSSEFRASAATLPLSSCCTPPSVAAIAASPDSIVDLEPAPNPQISSTTDPSDRQRAQVHLCGSFTNWLETVPMAPEPAPNGGSVFAVVCNLPPGYHQYKFIVDGEWRHDENQAFIQDPLGNVNNWCEHRPARASIPRARPTPRGDKTHRAKPPPRVNNNPRFFPRRRPLPFPDTDPRY